MADDFIAIDVQGISKLNQVLSGLPLVVRKVVIGEVSEFLLSVLRRYPGQRRITRKAAYGQSFQSDRQRRWFFAALDDGSLQIPYQRTQTLYSGWKMIGSGENVMLANEVPYAAFVMGDGQQARMMDMIGWKTTEEFVQERDADIMRYANSAANHAMAQIDRMGA